MSLKRRIRHLEDEVARLWGHLKDLEEELREIRLLLHEAGIEAPDQPRDFDDEDEDPTRDPWHTPPWETEDLEDDDEVKELLEGLKRALNQGRERDDEV